MPAAGVTPCDLPGVGLLCGAASSAAGTVAGGILGDMAKAAVDAETEVLKMLSAAFLSVPTPDLPSNGSAVAFLQNSLEWLMVAVAVVSLIIAGGRVAWSRKGQPATEAFGGILRLVAVVGAGVAGIGLLTKAGDAFSTWIIGQSTNNPGKSLTTLADLTGTAFTSPFLVLVVAALGILGFLVQIALLFVRSALLVVLAGIWPLSAAASMTPAGNAWYRKTTAWILAAVLYKPAAAICYAAAFHLMTASTTGIGVLEGIVLVLLATLALPALMKLVVPMAAAAGAIGTGSIIAGGAAAATGAMMIAGTAGGAAAVGGARGGAGGVGLIPKGGGGGGSGVPSGAAISGPAPAPKQPAAEKGPEAAGAARTAGPAIHAHRAVHGAVSGLTGAAEKLTGAAGTESN